MAPKKDKRSDETNSSEETTWSKPSGLVSTGATTPIEVVLPDLKPPSEEEARRYYSRLPSCPRLVGRTTGKELWQPPPMGGRIYPESEQVAAVGQHKIVELWDGIGKTVLALVRDLPWTSVDVVRIGLFNARKAADRPVIVWVGVSTADIPWPTVASFLRSCRVVLDNQGLNDVGVEIRVAAVYEAAAPALLPADITASDSNRQCYTTALGQPFAAEKAPESRGTLGLYLWAARAGQSTGLFALTCRHVAMPAKFFPGNHMCRRRSSSQPASRMVIPDNKSLARWIGSAEAVIETLQGDPAVARQRPDAENILREGLLQEALDWKRTLDLLEPISNRVVGDIFFSPPIGPAFYENSNNQEKTPWTRDWCLVRMNTGKFPDRQMPRNVVDLRSKKWEAGDVVRLLNPNHQSPYKFTYPKGGLLPLSGIVPLDELRRPSMMDKDGNDCILVGKRGAVSGLTFGAGNEIRSFVRRYAGMEEFISHEWVIVGLDRQVFSEAGDSGSVVFDIRGRVAGMVTGGSLAGTSASTDLTYATPMAQLMPDIADHMGHPVKFV